MKTNRFYSLMALGLVLGLTLTQCKKSADSPLSTTLAGTEISQVQNSDSQDAVADRNDQETDNTVDELQSNNYAPSSMKSSVSGTRTITIVTGGQDSTTFPKTIKIVYDNYQDSASDESFVKNGEIDIIVSVGAGNADKQLVTRAHTFKNFSITTDSTTVTVNGTRTVSRVGRALTFKELKSFRLKVTDNIAANLKYAITKTGVSDTMTFTRVVAKQRIAILNYVNVDPTAIKIWKNVKFRNIPALDTVSYTGVVTGTNEKGSTYTKSVTDAAPIIVTIYKGTPIISSGTMSLVTTSAANTVTSSFIITFKQDLPNHPFKTLVTVMNTETLKTHSFDRRFGRKFNKW